ncbi:MAG: flagellar basal body P-ring protein FlgI [Deltaproteobacteria bacterium]|jgi:flagellar P-ring protein precursor FlgI|nr:flagellar basal body P-ring protein FlgI [Deltaproteobacteria bacterium]
MTAISRRDTDKNKTRTPVPESLAEIEAARAGLVATLAGFLKKTTALSAAAILLAALLASPAHAIRLKELGTFEGVRVNQISGYGLVVGLNGTGDKDQTGFTRQSLSNLLKRMDITVAPTALKVKNVAAVMVTADLPPFVKPGTKIDVLVSSIGDSTSLQGGTLLVSAMEGLDNQIYAIAQGPISVGGFAITGQAASVQRNHPTVGRIVQGGTVEREVPIRWQGKETLSVKLGQPDFTTAARVAEAINESLPGAAARPLDAATIELRVPGNYRENLAVLVAELENVSVDPDHVGKVIINERTGSVVVGENVKLSTVAVAHGNLSIQIREGQNVSQPGPFSDGETVVTPETDINVEEGADNLLLIERSTNINDVVKALNAIGVTPRDLITIFQLIQAAGALHGELEIL